MQEIKLGEAEPLEESSSGFWDYKVYCGSQDISQLVLT